MHPELNTLMQQRIMQWDQQHGNDGIVIKGDPEWLLFGDGAKREKSGRGLLVDPPSDPQARLELRCTYLREKVRRAEHDFDELDFDLKSRFTAVARGNYVDIYDRDLDRLEDLQCIVLVRRRKYAEAQAELDALKNPKTSRLVDAESFAVQQRKRQRLDSIKI